MDERYEIGYGPYGSYFYDTQEGQDVTLEQVVHVMNDKDSGYAAGLEKANFIIDREKEYFNKDGMLACKRVQDKISDEMLSLED